MSGGEDLARALLDLQELAERLRRECPWDREQTTRSIVPHTVEEAYEVADAALTDDDAKLLDELGDLLYQTFFLALILEERGQGSLADVARAIHDKLVRRHPHVFGGSEELRTPGEVKQRWEALKSEQEGRDGIFDDVPETLPSLIQARKVQRRAATVGFDYPNVGLALRDLESELAELHSAIDGIAVRPEREPDRASAAELGDLLFACVNVARLINADPELELRRAAERFISRVEAAERIAADDGVAFRELPWDRQDEYFNRAKESSHRRADDEPTG